MGWAFIDDATGDVLGWQRWGAMPGNTAPTPPVGQTVVQAESIEAAKSAAQLLGEAKAEKIRQIDARSAELIGQGVAFKSETVSLSASAQLNLNGILTMHNAGQVVVPQPVSTIDGGEIEISDTAELMQLAGLMLGRIKAVLDAGRALRAEVLAASTVAEVEAIIDGRT